MLALMAATAQALLFTFSQSQRRAFDAQQAEALLDAAVIRAVLGIGDQRIEKRWPTDGSTQIFKFDSHEINVVVQDQLGLIDLNASDVSMFRLLFQSTGLNSNEADIEARRVIDWRSPASQSQKDEYAEAHLDYHPRHGPFQNVEELKLVLGISPELYKKVSPALTVYTNRPALDSSTAPEAALKALYFYTPEKVSMELGARKAKSASAPLASNFGGRTYSIEASIGLNGHKYIRKTVIMLTGDEHRPYLTLYWR